MKRVFLSMSIIGMLLISSLMPVQAATKTIYLTFDDGPSQNTPKILNILDQYNVKATFFVTGNGGRYTQYIGEAYRRGHAIGAHTYSHSYAIYRSVSTYYADLEKIENLIVAQTGARTDIIRFPGGSSNAVSRHYKRHIMRTLTKSVIANGYQYFDWNVSSSDASGRRVATKRIIRSAKSHLANIVLLMHDASPKTTTVKALPAIIAYYQARGYTFATLTKTSIICHHHLNN